MTQPTINAHLRDSHGYSLSESIKWAPMEMWRIHDLEHAERELGHDHDERGV